MRLSPSASESRVPFLVALLVAGFVACSALGSLAVGASRSFLLGTADKNYQPDYSKTLEKMVDVLMKPANSLVDAPATTTSSKSDPSSPATPAAVTSAPERELALEIALLSEQIVGGRPLPIPIQDGTVLRDGIGRGENGDNLKISVRPNQDCYLYVIAVDATGWAQPLFPNAQFSAAANPIAADRTLNWPDGSDWLFLDEYRGIETFYFVASRTQRADLESVLTQLAALQRPAPLTVARIEEAPVLARGIGGKRPGAATTITASNGSLHSVPSQAFLTELQGADLVVTRWFAHQ